jgi:hypothetical protein
MILEVCDICGNKLNNMFLTKYYIKKYYVDQSMIDMFCSRKLVLCQSCWNKIVMYIKSTRDDLL